MATDPPKYGTFEYYKARAEELEEDRNTAQNLANYYQKQLAKSHEILGRVTHQLSERWDSVRLTEHFPTDNLANKRSLKNPNGE